MDETSRFVKKNRATDVILVLKIMEGKAAINTIGVMDKRLFTGENKLHAVQDSQTSLWYTKYDQGSVPEVLKQKFTNFTVLLKFVTQYMTKRNIEIVEIID